LGSFFCTWSRTNCIVLSPVSSYEGGFFRGRFETGRDRFGRGRISANGTTALRFTGSLWIAVATLGSEESLGGTGAKSVVGVAAEVGVTVESTESDTGSLAGVADIEMSAKLDDDGFAAGSEDTGATDGEGSLGSTDGKSVVGMGAEVRVTVESTESDTGSLAGAAAVEMTGAKMDDDGFAEGLEDTGATAGEGSLGSTDGKSVVGMGTEARVTVESRESDTGSLAGSSSRSLVLLGSNACAGIAFMSSGNTPVPRNAPWAFSTVTDLLNAGLKTRKKSFFSSFRPAVLRVNIFISCCQACLKLLKIPRSNGCNQ